MWTHHVFSWILLKFYLTPFPHMWTLFIVMACGPHVILLSQTLETQLSFLFLDTIWQLQLTRSQAPLRRRFLSLHQASWTTMTHYPDLFHIHVCWMVLSRMSRTGVRIWVCNWRTPLSPFKCSWKIFLVRTTEKTWFPGYSYHENRYQAQHDGWL